MKKIVAMLLALMMVFALVACGQPDPTPSAEPSEDPVVSAEPTPSLDTENPVVIGHIADLTGAEALTGKEAQRAMAFAVKYIESMGGIDGRAIKVVELDAQSDTPSAASAARQLIEHDKVSCIVGPTLVPHKGAVAAVAKELGVPVVFYNPTPAGVIMGNDWAVGASGANAQMPTVMADYIYKELGYDKVYTLTKDDTGGTGYMNPFTEAFTALGGTVLGQEWVPSPTPDFMPYMAKFTDKEADALVAWTSSSDAIAFWKAWYDSGLNESLPVVGNFHGAFTDSFIWDALSGQGYTELVDCVLENGTYAPMTWAYNIDTPENKAFCEAWEAEFGAIPIGNNLPGAATQVMMLVKQAYEAIDGEFTYEKFRDALFAADVVGPEGRTAFTEDSNAAVKDVYVVKVVKLDDGTFNYEQVAKYSDVGPNGLSVG